MSFIWQIFVILFWGTILCTYFCPFFFYFCIQNSPESWQFWGSRMEKDFVFTLAGWENYCNCIHASEAQGRITALTIRYDLGLAGLSFSLTLKVYLEVFHFTSRQGVLQSKPSSKEEREGWSDARPRRQGDQGISSQVSPSKHTPRRSCRMGTGCLC